MTRIPYDQAAKALLDGVLENAGRVETQHELGTEPQWIDIWFEPDPLAKAPAGVLGRMARRACAFELFQRPPDVDQVLACLGKQIGLHQRALRKRGALREQPMPALWLIASRVPSAAMQAFAMQPLATWPRGTYRMPAPALPLRLVVVAELPRRRATLLLRLLGSGAVLAAALDDLARLPPGAWEQTAAARALDVLRFAELAPSARLDPYAAEIIMKATQVYERIKSEGRAEGVLDGERRIVASLLKERFGELPARIEKRISSADAATLERWARQVLTAKTLDEALGD